MQSAFPIVVFGTVGLSVVMSIVFLVSKGSAYDDIGQGGLPGGSPSFAQGMEIEEPFGMSPELQRAEREHEIRQMLQARSERLVRKGEPALDIEAEIAKLTAAAAPRPSVRIRGSPKRCCSWWSRATNGANARALRRWTSRPRLPAPWRSSAPEPSAMTWHAEGPSGINAPWPSTARSSSTS